jgi:hypothetical protein
MPTIINNNFVYILSDNKIIPKKLNKISYLRFNIPSYQLNKKNYIISTNNEYYMNEYKKFIKHDFHVIDINMSDMLDYCSYSNNNLIIVNKIFNNNNKINIHAIIYDTNNISFIKKEIII